MEGFPSILESVSALGIAGGPVFAFLWWLERAERKECQATTKDMLVQSLAVTNQAANSVTAVTLAVSELREVIRGSTSSLSTLIRSSRKPQ